MRSTYGLNVLWSKYNLYFAGSGMTWTPDSSGIKELDVLWTWYYIWLISANNISGFVFFVLFFLRSMKWHKESKATVTFFFTETFGRWAHSVLFNTASQLDFGMVRTSFLPFAGKCGKNVPQCNAQGKWRSCVYKLQLRLMGIYGDHRYLCHSGGMKGYSGYNMYCFFFENQKCWCFPNQPFDWH